MPTPSEIIERHSRDVPVKLGAIARDLGIEVFKSSMKPGISGLIEPSSTSPSGFKIRLNRHEILERQRFTLAHEIAHFLLHRTDIGGGLVDDVMYRSSLSTKKEVEANKLASVLIMPIHLITEKLLDFDHLTVDERVGEMAKLFRVSPAAMRIKLGV